MADRPTVHVPETESSKEPPKEPRSGGNYFAGQEKSVELYSSGCQLLDEALGGGWPIGRMSNIVGDKSTGKTLLAIEACSNFLTKYPKGKIWYNETESAFDPDYAAALGMPVDRITFVHDCFTVEAFFKSLKVAAEESKESGVRGLYVLDSLDALSDEAEQKRDIDDSATYGMQKAKKLSELFRREVKRLETSHVHTLIVSQTRDNIGVTFGEKQKRAGGKAMDFYASQVVWLAHKGQLKQTHKKVERVVGIQVMANVKKNKIGLPFRKVEFPIIFGYGVDDLTANIEWLASVARLEEALQFKDKKEAQKVINKLTDEEYIKLRKDVALCVHDAWADIELGFLPTRRKYK